MPIFIDVIKNTAVSLVHHNTKTAIGNLRGVIGSELNRRQKGGSPDLASKLDPKAWTFPLDVTNADQGLGNHGHYILFYINEQIDAELKFNKVSDRAFEHYSEAVGEHGIDEFTRSFINNPWGGEYQKKKNEFDNLIEGFNRAQKTKELNDAGKGSRIMGSNNTAHYERRPTTRMDTAIALYMPATVNVTYGANYTDTEIGGLAATAARAMSAAQEGGKGLTGIDKGLAVLKSIKNELLSDATTQEAIDAITKMMLSAAGAIPGAQGARELYEMNQGFIMTNRMELAFKGLPKRAFQYTFKMIPKSEQEAEQVKNIVSAFKMNMLPEAMASGDDKTKYTSKRLKMPNTFDIRYMYVSKENEYLHKISTCVLENMNVTYGGDRYKTFDGNEKGAPPVETTLTLNFKEMELITRQRAEEGF